MNVYEIEIKSLLGVAEKAHELRKKLQEVDPKTKLISSHKQLNHYFVDGDMGTLYDLASPKLSAEETKKFEHIVKEGSDFSIRTRLADDKVLFVVKTSVDEGTSHNTVSRLEFEVEIKDMTLDEFDTLIQEAGFNYQAKWSREREEYKCRDITVCLDKNAGYGYLAEFEKIIDDADAVEKTRSELYAFMNEIGFEELPQDRLGRMFEHYNAHWGDYYGTDKIFVIE